MKTSIRSATKPVCSSFNDVSTSEAHIILQNIFSEWVFEKDLLLKDESLVTLIYSELLHVGGHFSNLMHWTDIMNICFTNYETDNMVLPRCLDVTHANGNAPFAEKLMTIPIKGYASVSSVKGITQLMCCLAPSDMWTSVTLVSRPVGIRTFNVSSFCIDATFKSVVHGLRQITPA